MPYPAPAAARASAFTELLFEWIEDPLLIAHEGLVIAANQPACQLCRRTRSSFAGVNLSAAIDLLYQNSEGQPEVEVHRVAVDDQSYQVAVMRLAGPVSLNLENGSDPRCVIAADGAFVKVNPSYAALAACRPEELRGVNVDRVDPQIAERIAAARKSGFDRFEIRRLTADSSRFVDLDVTLSVLPRTGGHILGSFREVTSAKGSEAELHRVRRGLQMMETCVGLAQTARDRSELLTGVCESIVNAGGYAMAWIAVARPDGGKTVRAEASFGKNLEYLQEVQLDVEDTVLGAPAEPKQRVAMHSDFERAGFAPWRERALRYGFYSSLSLPVRSHERVEAALMIYAAEAGAFDDESVRVLGQVAGMLELGLEIQRKRAMQKAMEKNAQDWDEDFRAAFENSLSGMLVFDLTGKVLDANVEFCNRLGYTRQELVGMPLEQIVGPEHSAAAVERLESIRNDGFDVFETAHISRDGSAHRVELSCRTYTYGDDQIVLAISRDLAQATPAAGKSLHLALEASQTGLFDWDLRTNKVSYSSEWKAQLGYKDHEIGDDFAEWELRVHHDDQASVVEGLKAYLAKPDPAYEADFRMRHKNGSYRWILARGAILYGDGGKPERMLGSHVDITSRKRAHQQATQVQKLESVGRLAGGVAQDFRQVLSIVNGYSDLILPGLHEGDPLKARVRAIREAGERAQSLTQQLSDLSRREPLGARRVDLNTIVAGVEDTVRRLLGDETELITELCTEPRCISADPAQLTQLVVNLALNARDTMQQQGGRLTIAVGNAAALPDHLVGTIASPGPFIRLTVADTGPGLDEDTQLRIFDPFFTTQNADRGQGLGLALVSGIVRQHAGALTVGSDPGKGSTFDVYFPAVAQEPAVPAPAEESVERGGGTVLVVQPDAALRRFVIDILKSAGYRTLEAAGAGEALLLGDREEGCIDLVLTDRVMPLIAGPELIERLRQRRPTLKALYPALPYSPDALARAVAEALAKAESM